MGERLRSKSSEKLYFSFGHDVHAPAVSMLMQVTIFPVLTALGVFPKEAYIPLGTKAIQWNRAFRSGNLVPFCGNVIVEKLRCADGDYVRVLNNQVPSTIFGKPPADKKSLLRGVGMVLLDSQMDCVR
jgi:hypothetical protein